MRARAQNRFMLVLSGAKLALTVPLVLGGPRRPRADRAPSLGWIAAEALARVVLLRRAAALFEVPLSAHPPAARARAAGGGDRVRDALRRAGASCACSGPLLLRLAACGVAFAAAYLGLSWSRGAGCRRAGSRSSRRAGRARLPLRRSHDPWTVSPPAASAHSR